MPVVKALYGHTIKSRFVSRQLLFADAVAARLHHDLQPNPEQMANLAIVLQYYLLGSKPQGLDFVMQSTSCICFTSVFVTKWEHFRRCFDLQMERRMSHAISH